MTTHIAKSVTTRPEYRLKGRGRVIVTPDVAAQIDALHKAHPGKEWSGVLVFEPINDNIIEPDEVVLRTIAIFPMDFGSSGYTEYELGEEILTIYETFPTADPANGTPTLRLGQIHSHHSMPSFFSGTDDSELRDNVGKYDYYLSLIVNLSGQYVAKVAFEADIPQTIKVKDKKTGEAKHIEQDPKPIIAVFELTVVREHVPTPEWFDEQVAVLKAKPEKHYTYSELSSPPMGQTHRFPGYGGGYHGNTAQSPASTTNSSIGRRFEDESEDYWDQIGREYEEKKAEEKEKNTRTNTSTTSCPITREQVRSALQFLFQTDEKLPLRSALLVLADHPLNNEDATEEQRHTWTAIVLGKLEYWMYDHFLNELIMLPDEYECAVLETVYEIIAVCRVDSPLAISLCKGLKAYIEVNYPGITTLKMD